VGLIVILAAAVATSVGYATGTRQTDVDIPLDNVLPANNVATQSVTSYWADAHHIVCCFQGYSISGYNSALGYNGIARRCLVYDFPSGRSWRFPVLDSQGSTSYAANDLEWDLIRLSKDRKRLFTYAEGDWYDMPAPVISPATTSSKWTRFAGHYPITLGIVPEPYKQDPRRVSSTNKIENWFGAGCKSISPSGHQMAWIDKDVKLSHNILSNRPIYALWTCNAAGSHIHRVGAFGAWPITAFDISWSPDEKHISCVSIMHNPKTPKPSHSTTDNRLTIFNVAP